MQCFDEVPAKRLVAWIGAEAGAPAADQVVFAAIIPLTDLEMIEAIEDAADARAADEAKAEGGAMPLADSLESLQSGK